MSLIFDVDKDKSIAMMVETSGIDDVKKLDFVFNISVNGIKYGFPCKLEEGKVNICIPALSEVIKGLKIGKYKASLDVIGDKGYFLQPFNEEVELVAEPKVGVIVDDDYDKKKQMKEAITATISGIIELDDKVVKPKKISDDNKINTDVKESNKTKSKSPVSKMFS